MPVAQAVDHRLDCAAHALVHAGDQILLLARLARDAVDELDAEERVAEALREQLAELVGARARHARERDARPARAQTLAPRFELPAPQLMIDELVERTGERHECESTTSPRLPALFFLETPELRALPGAVRLPARRRGRFHQ